MNPNPANLDPIERLMAETAAARQAGVFGRTTTNVEDLLTHRPTASWAARHRHALVGLSMAACLMLVVFLGAYHNMRQSGSDRSLAMTNSLNFTSETAVACSVESIGSCFTGPGQGPVAPECACADFDGDGDVDLRDMSAIQLQGGLGP